MALRLDEIRALAERVAASHALDVVDIEYLGGGGKHRTLRVYIEKNEGERAKLRERVAHILALQAMQQDGDEPEAEQASGPDEEALSLEAVSEEDEALLEGLPSVTNLELLSGVTHEDCELFSRDFGTVLDVEELVPGTEYLLEVSSPGLDRRLTRAEEYQRFSGSLVKLQTVEPVDGNRHWQGRIAGVEDGRLTLELVEARQGGKAKKSQSKARATTVTLMMANIEKAQLVPEF